MSQVIDAPPVEPAPVAIDARILERREEVARQRTRRRLRIAGVVGGVVVVLGATWAVLHSPVLAARRVTVIGAVHTGDASVVTAVGLTGQPLVDVNPGRVATRVEALPWVARATVTRHWPDDVTVRVVERLPAAVVETPGRPAVLIDGTGHVLSVVRSVAPGAVVLDAPVTAGGPGSVLGAPARPGLSALAAVPPLLQRRIERVTVADDGDVTLALTGNIGATLGPATDLAAKYGALISVLVDVPPTRPEVVDVSVPDAPAVGPPPPPATAVRHAPRPPAPTVTGPHGRPPQIQPRGQGPS